eukprot:gene31155-40510_t
MTLPLAKMLTSPLYYLFPLGLLDELDREQEVEADSSPSGIISDLVQGAAASNHQIIPNFPATLIQVVSKGWIKIVMDNYMTCSIFPLATNNAVAIWILGAKSKDNESAQILSLYCPATPDYVREGE